MALRVLAKSVRTVPQWCVQLEKRVLSSQAHQLPVLTMFTKKNEHCSLCESAKQVLESYKDKLTVEEVFIDAPGNESLWDLYKFDIPVFHLNGEPLMKHRVNEKLLLKKLETFNL